MSGAYGQGGEAAPPPYGGSGGDRGGRGGYQGGREGGRGGRGEIEGNNLVSATKQGLTLEETEPQNEKKYKSEFDCNLCHKLAQDPILTLCGHMFCWSCIHKLTPLHACPLCKSSAGIGTLTPIYGRDDDVQLISDTEIPPRPLRRILPAWKDDGQVMIDLGEEEDADCVFWFKFIAHLLFDLTNQLNFPKFNLLSHRRSLEPKAVGGMMEGDQSFAAMAYVGKMLVFFFMAGVFDYVRQRRRA